MNKIQKRKGERVIIVSLLDWTNVQCWNDKCKQNISASVFGRRELATSDGGLSERMISSIGKNVKLCMGFVLHIEYIKTCYIANENMK